VIRIFRPQLVADLLQTRDVARVALPFCCPSKSADDMRAPDRPADDLLANPHPPRARRMSIVIDQAALR
jgi:hypothetical protein